MSSCILVLASRAWLRLVKSGDRALVTLRTAGQLGCWSCEDTGSPRAVGSRGASLANRLVVSIRVATAITDHHFDVVSSAVCADRAVEGNNCSAISFCQAILAYRAVFCGLVNVSPCHTILITNESFRAAVALCNVDKPVSAAVGSF